MANVRDIKRRIRAIQNTRKITKAMEMVAAAKLRRAQERALAARPYARSLAAALGRLAGQRALGESHPLLEPKAAGPLVFCLITADRGLAGSYNANLIRFATAALGRSEGPVAVVAVGRKGRDHFRRLGVPVLHSVVGVGDEARYALAAEIAEELMGLFLTGRARAVRLIYAEFRSALSQRPVEVPLLPLQPPAGEEAPAPAGKWPPTPIFIPSPVEVFAALLPKLVNNLVYQGLLEAKASEHAARMTAMRSATENAGELIEELVLEFNRARQTAITTEIAEIVGGAEALKA